MPAKLVQPFGDNIWTVDGPVVTSFGFRYPTRMAIIKLADGGLFALSPIALSEDLRGEVDAIGAVTHIVAPNSLHHLFLTEWQTAYPGAQVYAPPGLRQRRKDIAFDGDIGDGPAPWSGDIDHVAVNGNVLTTEVVCFHRASGTVLFTDLLQNFSPDWFTGWQAMIARLDLMVGDEPQVPRKFRVAFTNRKAARAAVRQILAWPATQVLMAHGTPVREDGAAFIARAFQWLIR